MAILSPALGDRSDRKVFQGITEASAYQAMTRACRNAKSLDVYSHVMPPDEIACERFVSLLMDEGK